MTTTEAAPVTEVPQAVISMPVPQQQMRGAGVLSLIERYVRDPSIDVVKLEGMVALQERLMRWEAETAWNTAMAEAQSEMRAVSKDSANPQTHSRYASYAAIDAVLRPIYSKHGFALSFNTEESRTETWVKIVCAVTKGGHSKQYQIDMPADGKGARGNDVMTKTHATGSAVTYGMRYLATMIFNLAMTDDDGNGAGRAEVRRTPRAPAPNVMAPHDPETGEIHESPRGDDPPAMVAAPSNDSAPGGAATPSQTDILMKYDAELAAAAEKGLGALAALWKTIPGGLQVKLVSAKERRHKPRAAEIDANGGV